MASSSNTQRPTSAPSRYLTLLSIGLLLLASLQTTAAAKKRLSRDDLPAVASPIKLAAEAPVGDNIATASDADSAVSVSAPNASAPSAAEAAGEEDATTASDDLDANFQAMMDECDPDMIGFEIITG